MDECVSCGGEANPKSPRDFCNDCDEHFEQGLAHQAEVTERAERLAAAQESGDAQQVSDIMSEIFKEAAFMQTAQPVAVVAKSAATARKSKGGK